jgi:hypothetical protein
MTGTHSSETTNQLLLLFIFENIDYRKRCLFLQEIISLSKVNDIWRQALAAFFDPSDNNFSLNAFSKN